MGCTLSTATAPSIQNAAPAQVHEQSRHSSRLDPEALAEVGIVAAESLQDSVLMLGNMEASPERVSQEAVTVLECVEDAIGTVMALLGKSKEQKVNVQSIQLAQRSAVEQGLAKYSALGQVLISLSQKALEGLPFGAPVAAALGAVYGRASQAAMNSENCRVLLKLVKSCDAQLARIATQSSVPPEVEEGLLELAHAILDGAQLMHSYAGRGFIMRFIASTSHAQQFQRIDQKVRGAMQKVSFATSIEVLVGSYKDESAALRTVVCQAAGLPEHKSQEALKQLSSEQPQRLRSLLEQHGNFTTQVITAELSALGVRIDILEGRMDYYMESTHEDVRGIYLILQMNEKEKEHSSAFLADYLRHWWDNNIKRRGDKTEVAKFLDGLLRFCEAQGWMPELLSIEEELSSDEDLLGPIAAATKRARTTYDGKQLAFLDLVVLPLLDRNKDGLVTKQELLWLQMQGDLFAQNKCEPRPSSWMELLNVIFKGVDANDVMLRLELSSEWNTNVAEVVKALQVSDVIHSYGVEAMLQEFVEGTRDWMYEKVQEWLDEKLSCSTSESSRMFLLLAGPGMGKSLFSARMQSKLENQKYRHRSLIQVRHFFKVGEQRSQGKAMILCLAHQLAEQLSGFAEELLDVVRKHRNASTLSMTETFEAFLLLPMQELDKQGKQDHTVVILLDALDEASDGGKDWRAVAGLIAKEFLKLPSWVKVIMTGRPQAEAAFHGWDPYWIRPDDTKNEKDLHMLILARLKQRQAVEPQDVPRAASIILEKSQGEFVYAKYAFHELTSKQRFWTPEDLKARLPAGLSGMFRYKLRFLQDSLYHQRPDLLRLLRHQMLPILVAAKEPLSPIQCAYAAKVDVAQVQELLDLLAPFYFMRLGGGEEGGLRIYPYHKSVRDWLTGEGVETAGLQFSVDVKLGHGILGQACFDCLQHEPPSSSHQGPSSSGDGASMFMYALRYGVVHLGESGAFAQLEKLVLDFPGLWQRAYAAGFGPEVLKDLTSPGLQSSAVVQDTVRWLRIVNNYLIEHPQAALQLACDAPHDTIVARRAAQFPCQPRAFLVTKDKSWTSCLSTLLGHSNIISSVALTPDGQTIVSSSDDRTTRIWDLSSGQLLGMLENDEAVVSVSVSPDSSKCVTGSTSSTCKIWDLASGQLVRSLGDAGETAHTSVVRSVAVSPDGIFVATGSRDGMIKIWSMETGQLEMTIDSATDDVNSLAISPDGGTIIAACDDLALLVLDIGPAGVRRMRRFESHEGVVLCAAISPDGKTCASGSMDETIKIWDLCTGELTSTLEGHSNAVACIKIMSLNGKMTVISGSWDATMRLWDLHTGKCESTFEGHSGRVTGLAIGLDGSTLCSSSWDKSIRVWDLSSNEAKPTLEEQHTASVEDIAVSVDGKYCITGSVDKNAKIWDLVNGKLKVTLRGHTDFLSNVAISPDMTACITIALFDPYAVREWDMSTGIQTAAHKRGSEEASVVKARAHEWAAVAEEAFRPTSSHLSMIANDSVVSLGEPGDHVFLMPPIRPKKFQKLMYEKSSHTFSFFSEKGTFVRYQLQPSCSR